MEDGVLPFEKTPLTFIIAIICFAAFVVAVATAAFKYSWHRRLLWKLKNGNSGPRFCLRDSEQEDDECDIELGFPMSPTDRGGVNGRE